MGNERETKWTRKKKINYIYVIHLINKADIFLEANVICRIGPGQVSKQFIGPINCLHLSIYTFPFSVIFLIISQSLSFFNWVWKKKKTKKKKHCVITLFFFKIWWGHKETKRKKQCYNLWWCWHWNQEFLLVGEEFIYW